MKFRSLNLSLLGSLEAQQKLVRSLSCGSVDGIFGMMEPGETDCAYLGNVSDAILVQASCKKVWSLCSPIATTIPEALPVVEPAH
jgi:hypothetical protein